MVEVPSVQQCSKPSLSSTVVLAAGEEGEEEKGGHLSRQQSWPLSEAVLGEVSSPLPVGGTNVVIMYHLNRDRHSCPRILEAAGNLEEFKQLLSLSVPIVYRYVSSECAIQSSPIV